jgi:hypothetical protein
MCGHVEHDPPGGECYTSGCKCRTFREADGIPTPDEVREMIAFSFEGNREDAYAIADAALARVRAEAAAEGVELARSTEGETR